MRKESESIDLVCPQCRSRYTVDESLAGRRVQCELCSSKFYAPTSELSRQAEEHEPDPAALIKHDLAVKYEVGDIVAQGGMGRIRAARDRNIRRTVAMKVLLDPEQAPPSKVLRFIEEAQVTGQLEHPGIVPVYELGLDVDNHVFYTMKYVRGATLAEILVGLANHDETYVGKYLLIRLLNVFLKTCDAVAFAHSRGVVHRDLKPANIMIGDFGEVLLMDWGLAKVVHDAGWTAPAAADSDGKARKHGSRSGDTARIAMQVAAPVIESVRGPGVSDAMFTMDGQILGTPMFMAPEQAEGRLADIDSRTDIYALGAILYNILTLRPPVSGSSTRDVLQRVLKGAITPPSELASSSTAKRAGTSRASDSGPAGPGRSDPEPPLTLPHCPGRRVPDALSAVAMKALALKPNHRYQSVKELQADIEAYQAGFATVAEKAGLLRQLMLLVRRHKLIAGSFLAVILALGIGCGAALLQRQRALAAKTAAENAEAEARKAELQARTAARDAHESELAAQSAAREAREAEANEAEQRRAAEEALAQLEWENYCNVIAVADARIDDGFFAEAETLLWSTPVRLRHWEWGRLMWLCHQDLLSLAEHPTLILGIDLDPDGERIATACYDGTVRVFSARTGEVLLTTRPPQVGTIQSSGGPVAFSPDGKRLAVAGNRAAILDAQSGRELLSLAGDQVVFSPDNVHVATGDWVGRIVRMWDGEGRELWRMEGRHAVFSPDGRHVGTLAGNQLRICDATTGQVRLTHDLPEREKDPVLFEFSPDGNALLGRDNDTAVVLDVRTGEQLLACGRENSTVLRAAFSPNGRRIVTVDADRIVVLWDAQTGAELHAFLGELYAAGLAFFPDGCRVAGATPAGTVRILDTEGVGSALTLVGHVYPEMVLCGISPDGTRVVTCSYPHYNRVKMWNAETGEELFSIDHSSEARAVDFSPDGQRFLVNGCSGTKFRVYDTQSGEELLKPGEETPRGNRTTYAVFSPDGTRVAVAEGNAVGIYDATTRQGLLSLRGHRAEVLCASYSHDGARIVTGSVDHSVRVADAHTGEELLCLPDLGDWVNSAVFSPDGSRIATTGYIENKSATVWDSRTGEQLLTLAGHAMGVCAVVFSPDGERIATASLDQTARIWDARTGRQLLVLKGHKLEVISAAFSRDGLRLVTGSQDAVPRVWNAFDWRLTREDVVDAKRERYARWLQENRRK